MGKIYAKLVAGTENDKHDNYEIIKIENTQENSENDQSHEKMRYFYRDGQTDIYLFGNQNLLKQRRVSKALPSSVLAVYGLKCIYRNCVSVLKSYDFVRETREILGTYSYESDASLELLISQWTLLADFFHPSIRHSPVKTLFTQLHLFLAEARKILRLC
jgi:hypothetical protein